MKKNKVLKIILIILAVLLAPILLLILGWLLIFLFVFAVDSHQASQCRRETISQFYEQREKLEQSVTKFEKFPCGDRSFLTGGETYGYFYSPDDTYNDFFSTEPERQGRGFETRNSATGVDYRDYAEKICDNWYYYRECYNY